MIFKNSKKNLLKQIVQNTSPQTNEDTAATEMNTKVTYENDAARKQKAATMAREAEMSRLNTQSTIQLSEAEKQNAAASAASKAANEVQTNSEAEQLMVKAGLMTAEQLETKATIQASLADIQLAINSGKVTLAEGQQIATTLGLDAAQLKASSSATLLGKALNFIKAHPIIVATVALTALVSIIDLATTSTEEYREKLEDLKREYNELTSEIQSVNSELKTTIDRMKELEGKDSLTFTEKEEYDNLVKINNELQRKVDLLQLEQEQKNKDKNKTFVKTMVSDTENPFEREVNPNGKNEHQYQLSDNYLTSEIGYMEAQFEIRDQLLEDLQNAETEKEKDRIQKRIDEIDKYLNDKNEEWGKNAEEISYIENPTTEDDKSVNEWLDFIADFQDRMAIAISRDDASLNAQYKTNAFNRVVDNWQFDDTVQGLQNLGKEGKVTADMLADPKYDEFINKLILLGVINSAEDLNAIALAFNSVAIEAQNAGDATSNLLNNISYVDYMSNLEKLSAGLDQLGDIYEDVKNKDDFDWSSLLNNEDFKESFGGLGEEYDNFIKTITTSPDDIEACQTAFDELASAYISESEILKDVTKETKDATIAFLKQKGIKNAATEVDRILAQKEKELALETKYAALTYDDLANATVASINALVDEGKITREVANEMELLAFRKQWANKSVITTSGDIRNLAELATASVELTNMLNALASAKAAVEAGAPKKAFESTIKDLEKRINDYLNGNFGSHLNVDEYEAPDLGSGSKNSDNYFDWIETRLNNLNEALEETKEIAEDTFNGWTERSNAYDKTMSDIIALKTEQEKARTRYMEEANKSGLSEEYKRLVENGAIDITKLSNDDPLTEQIQSYQEWYEKAKACDDAIKQLDKNFEETYRDSRSFRWETFDYLMDSISRVTEEAEYLIGLLSEEDLFDDNGNKTKYADATLALHFSNIGTYQQLAKDYLEEIDSINKEINENGSSQELIDRKNELIDAHREAVDAANKEKQSALDLVEEGYNKQLDALNKLIDKKKEAMNAEKDLYDYQKSVEEQSKKVTSLQRQYDVYKNDMSEEGKAQAQKIKVELESAREALEETQYEKYLSDQEMMLDKLSADYEEWMNNRLDDEEALLKQIADSLAPGGEIIKTLQNITKNNGSEISTDITNSIINGTTSAVNNIAYAIIKALGGDISHIDNVGTFKGHANGIKRSGKEWAWTQEEGVELIRTKDGALLTPLDNSMVFNNESSRRLWEFSQNPVDYLNKLGIQDIAPQINMISPKLPEVARNVSSNPVVNLGGINIVCNEVSNADEIVNDLISNKKFEKAMYSAVGNAMTGGNSLSKYRY